MDMNDLNEKSGGTCAPSEQSAPTPGERAPGPAAWQDKPAGFFERVEPYRIMRIGIIAACTAVLLGIVLPRVLNAKEESGAAGMGAGISPPSAQYSLPESPVLASPPAATPSDVRLFPDGQVFSDPFIGVTVQAPGDFAISSGERNVIMERGKSTLILIGFGYHSAYTSYSVEEYVAHLHENMKNDFETLGMDMEWEVTGGEYVSLGGSRAYRVDTRIGGGADIRADIYLVSPKAGEGVYLVYVLQNITVPDAEAHQKDNELILQSLVVGDGENCGLTVLKSADMPIKLAYDTAYCGRVEENPAQNNKVANIYLYPADEERYALLINDVGAYAQSAEEAFAAYERLMADEADFRMEEMESRVWGERTYERRYYELKQGEDLLMGIYAVTEINGRLYALDQCFTEETGEEAVGFLVGVMSTLAPQ